MKMSTITLQDLKDNVPIQLTGRYSVNKFPINSFNAISQHLEKYADTPYMTEQMIIPWVNGITDYPLDDRVRQGRGVYLVPNTLPLDANRHVVVSGTSQRALPSVQPDKSNPIRFTELNNILRIDYVPAAEEPIYVDDRTIVDSTGSTLTTLFDVDASGPLAPDQGLRGKAIIITYVDGTEDHLMIASNDNTAFSLTINGIMSQIPTNTTRYSIYNNFWIFEYAIYLPRFDINGNLSSIIGVPLDFEEVYKWGIFWKYYAQEGENKVEIDRYQSLFDKEAMRFASDQNRFRSDNKITFPRDIPRLFPRSSRR